ncbi:hypothetical protein [Pseudoalteromonas aurantia]|uniref:Uncharacterized protein n=1 Tax=Pseudoalteromonas aurantia 208 TaxID=1314867 RepID=A0ABR9EBE0_9GAMM|nr:hypothetical protein [Pseudoalteromonas aurantia]MBE0368137.1 hypothetical protein [Pseudoalteromonas aurantia 208]
MNKEFFLLVVLTMIYICILISMTKRVVNEVEINLLDKIFIVAVCWLIPFVGLFVAKLSLPSKSIYLGDKNRPKVPQDYTSNGDS